MSVDERERVVLGIESSCDETAASVVVGGVRVRSNVIATQHELHAEYRGVVPEIASRAHAERIGVVIERALSEAGIGVGDLHAVAVANRPGLIGSLLVGVSAAKALAWSLGLPLVGVDHVRAHLFAGFLVDQTPGAAASSRSPTATSAASATSLSIDEAFPALGLVVSGGHSVIERLESPVDSVRLGSTRDDAIGEAYDKAAAVLGLDYPGGPIVDRLARTGNPARFVFPISRLDPGTLDFSFSGLKTSVLYTVRGVPSERGRGGTPPLPLDEATIADVCAGFQHAAVEAVVLKLRRAMDRHPECRTLLVGGGVSANSRLREALAALCDERGLRLSLPPMAFCLDNGAMIAGLGHETLARRAWRSDELSLSAHPSSA
jgi:N6-L-threonylcarbamoyladenine synthase